MHAFCLRAFSRHGLFESLFSSQRTGERLEMIMGKISRLLRLLKFTLGVPVENEI